MLNAKENMREAIKGGNPERFVNQYEAIQLLFSPNMFHDALLKPGDMNVKNAWGITNSFPVGTPGQFPVHTPDKIVAEIHRSVHIQKEIFDFRKRFFKIFHI